MEGKNVTPARPGSTYALQDIQVVVGLGNPGGRFALTRHNIGFMVLDYLADQYGGRWSKEGKIKECFIQVPLLDGSRHRLHLIKPMAFMNHSGHVIRYLKKEGLEAHQMVVVHDELEKKFSYVGKRLGGSPRGHNGLKSIIEFFGPDFWRVRIGIGRPDRKTGDVSDYVLSRFSDEEMASIPTMIARAEKEVVE